MFYYWAANIQKYIYWLKTPHSTWCNLEAETSSSLTALLLSSPPVYVSKYTNNQFLICSLKIWYKFRRHFGSTSVSALTPVCNNHIFPPAFSDSSFSIWARKGIKSFHGLFRHNTFVSFRELSSL